MSNSYSKADYLRALFNASRQNINQQGTLINPSIQLGDLGVDLTTQAHFNTQMQTANQNINARDYQPKTERNWYQRTIDTITEFSYQINQGLAGWMDGIFDTVVYGLGQTGSLFGADTQWAEDLIKYDWESQYLNLMALTQPTAILSGDVFTLDYWQSYDTLASSEASRERLYELEQSSYSSEMSETAQKYYKGGLQAIGNVLPNVALAAATGGASVGAQVAARGVALGGAFAGGFGGSAEEALTEGATYDQAGASGLIGGSIEVGTEFLLQNVGKMAGKVLGRSTTFGQRVGGAMFNEQTLATALKEGVKRVTVRELGKAALEEGTEELINELLSPLTRIPYQKGAAFEAYTDSEQRKQLLEDAALSFTSGAIAGVFASGTQSAVQKQRINTIKSNINADGVALVEQVENIVNLHKEKTALTKADGSLDTVAIDNLELKLDTEIRKYFEMSADYIQEHGFETAEHLLKVIGENPNDTIKRYQKETGVKLDAEGKRALTEQAISEMPKMFNNLIETTTYQQIANEAADAINRSKLGEQTQVEIIVADEQSIDPKYLNSEFVTEGIIIDIENNTKRIIINEKVKADIFSVISHEALGHAILDSDTRARDNLIKSIKANERLNKIYHQHDMELENTYKQEAIESERLARFLENYINNYNSFNRVLKSHDKSRIRNMLNRTKTNLESVFSIGDKKLQAEVLHKLDKALKTITSPKAEQTKQVAYNKKQKPMEAIIFIAPNYKTDVTKENYNDVKNKVMPIYVKNLNTIANELNIEFEYQTGLGGYSAVNYGSVTELTTPLKIKYPDIESAQLFTMLAADLGYQVQNEVIFAIPVNKKTENAQTYNIIKTNTTDLFALSDILKEVEINDFTTTDKDGNIELLKGNWFSAEEIEAFWDKVDNLTSLLKERGILKHEKIDTRRIGYVVEYRETRVYTKGDRSHFYKTWLEENRRTHRGTNRYRLVSKAYERVIQALEAENGLVEHFKLVDDDGNPQYSRRLKDKGVRESQHRAQHTQAEYLPLKNVSDVFKNIKDNIITSAELGVAKVSFPNRKLATDVVINFNNGKQLADIATEAVDFILDTKVSFPNRKLATDVVINFNNGKQLADIATEAVDFILDTKVSFPDIVEVEGDAKVTFKGSDIALKEYLKSFGYDVEVYRDTMILELHNELAEHKKETKLEKLHKYINRLIKEAQTNLTRSVDASKSFLLSKNVLTKINDNFRMPSGREIHSPELAFYRGVVSNINLSRTKYGFSPKTATSVVNALQNYTLENMQDYAWIEFNPIIRENADLLASKFNEKGVFPNRALTLEETEAMRQIIKAISKDVNFLISDERQRMYQSFTKAQQEVNVAHMLNADKRTSWFTRELDKATGVGFIIGNTYGYNSDTYKISFANPEISYEKFRLTYWKFFNDFKDLYQKHNVKESSLI